MKYLLWLWIVSLAVAAAFAQEPSTLTANSPDEPPAAAFSMDKAVRFLDAASLAWQRDRNCFTCHTNYVYLMARPLVDASAPAHREVRAFAERMVAGWAAKPPSRYYEIPGHAVFLAINDAHSTGRLQPATRAALDKMWAMQNEDGSLRWPDCKWPPMESDQHYGMSMIALAVGLAPDSYITEPAAQAGLDKVRRWLAAHPPQHLHQRAMLLWASQKTPGLITAQDQQKTIAELRAIQNPDGGWAMTRLGDWPRGDGKPQTFDSDGYGAGFVIYVLRQSGIPAADPAIASGIQWLKTHQRESGRWFTRSGFKDNKHYLTHAGTALAVMALKSCER